MFFFLGIALIVCVVVVFWWAGVGASACGYVAVLKVCSLDRLDVLRVFIPRFVESIEMRVLESRMKDLASEASVVVGGFMVPPFPSRSLPKSARGRPSRLEISSNPYAGRKRRSYTCKSL